MNRSIPPLAKFILTINLIIVGITLGAGTLQARIGGETYQLGDATVTEKGGAPAGPPAPQQAAAPQSEIDACNERIRQVNAANVTRAREGKECLPPPECSGLYQTPGTTTPATAVASATPTPWTPAPQTALPGIVTPKWKQTLGEPPTSTPQEQKEMLNYLDALVKAYLKEGDKKYTQVLKTGQNDERTQALAEIREYFTEVYSLADQLFAEGSGNTKKKAEANWKKMVQTESASLFPEELESLFGPGASPEALVGDPKKEIWPKVEKLPYDPNKPQPKVQKLPFLPGGKKDQPKTVLL